MKRKILILVLVVAVVSLFIIKGIPLLKSLKQEPGSPMVKSEKMSGSGNISGRPVTVDISIESMCTNLITNERYAKCNKDNCDDTCDNEGCKFFGLNFLGSDYKDGKCYCKCYEENKIKKALNPIS